MTKRTKTKKTAGMPHWPVTSHYTVIDLIQQMNLTFEFYFSAITPAEIERIQRTQIHIFISVSLVVG